MFVVLAFLMVAMHLWGVRAVVRHALGRVSLVQRTRTKSGNAAEQWAGGAALLGWLCIQRYGDGLDVVLPFERVWWFAGLTVFVFVVLVVVVRRVTRCGGV